MVETHKQHTRCPIAPAAVRYIKLGPGNAWAEQSLNEGRLTFGHHGVSHEAAAVGDWDRVREVWSGVVSPGKANDFLREVRDFYTLGPDCLWITFHAGRMWWAFAETEIVPFDAPSDAIGSRYRRVLGGWSSQNIKGEPLVLNDISSRLTKTGAYRQTLCTVQAEDYAIRLINGEESPAICEARQARQDFESALLPLIQSLHQNDFEVLVELIFTRLGWVRVSGIGGQQKDTDFVLEQPITGARALVQIKSEANQTALDAAADALRGHKGDARYIVCHTPHGPLSAPDGTHLWTRPDLAGRLVQAGLTDWLIARAT